MPLDNEERHRFGSIRRIDLTTYGRRTGIPRRIEIWWFLVDDRFIITGTPARRDWLANVRKNPNVTIHVDGRDITATASEITDPTFRRHFFSQPETRWYSSQSELARLVHEAPMIEILFD